MVGSLTVLHARKGEGVSSRPEGLGHETLSGRVLELETCQRWLRVICDRPGTSRPGIRSLPPGVDQFLGLDAYAFLLRVATGLASELAGETNILGQVKEAWSEHLNRETWLQCLLEDAKDIRSRFLSGVGTPSYGRLVRQALSKSSVGSSSPILLLGAGDLAQSVAPWLRHQPLLLWNRSPERASQLALHLLERPGASVTVLTEREMLEALTSTAAIVACIPFDGAQDEQRCGRITKVAGPRVIHLGGPRLKAGPWRTLQDLICLDDLFARQNTEGQERRRRIQQAIHACEERARLRSLGKSLSIAHGWEDLALFVHPTAMEIRQAA